MARPTKKEAAMLLRKLVLAVAALIVSAPVLADSHWRDHDEWRERHFEHHYYPSHYYYPQYYRPAPRVVVVERPVYPLYEAHPAYPMYPAYPVYPAYQANVDVNTGLAIVAGALIGGVIAHELVR
jgi:hypothetical protein